MANQNLWSRRAVIGFLGSSALALGACAGLGGQSADNKPPASTTSAAPAPAQITTKGPKKRIAVLRFDVRTSDRSISGVDLMAAEMLTTSLFKTGQFIVIERNILDKVLQEQALGRSGVVDASTAAQLGQVLGLQAIVTGAVTQLGLSRGGGAIAGFGIGKTIFEAAIDIRAIDTTTARLILADHGEGHVETTQLRIQGGGGGLDSERQKLLGDALRKATEDVTQKLVAQLQTVPWAGRIAEIASGSIYVNAGLDLGLQAGSRLAVYRRGKEIKDPVTKETLGWEESPIGQLLLTDVKERFSVATPSNGTGFRQNDIVRLTER